jgi:hypothetical protein
MTRTLLEKKPLITHAVERLKVSLNEAYPSWKIGRRYTTFYRRLKTPNFVRHGAMAKQTSSSRYALYPSVSVSIDACISGEVTERLKVHDWKICGRVFLSFSRFISGSKIKFFLLPPISGKLIQSDAMETAVETFLSSCQNACREILDGAAFFLDKVRIDLPGDIRVPVIEKGGNLRHS